MTYTYAMYEEDNRIAKWVYYKKFKGYAGFKEDLIQSCIIALYRARELYNEEKGKYISYAVQTCIYTMIDFLKLEKKKNNLGLDLSLDCELDEGYTIEETLGESIDYEEKFRTEDLKNEILKIILKRNYKDTYVKDLVMKRKTELRQCEIMAIEYFVNGKSEKQIREDYGVTRQCVNKIINQYRKKIQNKLENLQ